MSPISGLPAPPEMAGFLDALLRSRRSSALTLPSSTRAAQFAGNLLKFLFPHFSEDVYFSVPDLEGELLLLLRDLKRILHPLAPQLKRSIEETADTFAGGLPLLYRSLLCDAEAIYRGDPAAENVDEVISAYPGFFAIAVYRIAHEFYRLEVPLFPRILSESAHQRTGIDIHPGAKIGTPFFIDHGTGIVIGETTVIGDNVKVYQGVTLGALSVEKKPVSSKRHPTIEDNVVLYSNATILGGETVIGHDSIIGGNVWLTESVLPYSVVYHKSEIHVRNTREQETIGPVLI
jgi:serine O-acetyltransferase